MTIEKKTGLLLLIGATGLLVPFTILGIIFDYPDILRQDTRLILQKFQEGGTGLIWTWWAFAMVGLPLLLAYVQIGRHLEHKLPFVRWVSTLGVVGLVSQMIGLLRWTFVVPVLARTYQQGDEATKAAVEVSFQLIHQFGGVLLGEHIGQLFTIIWTTMMAYAFRKLLLIPAWVAYLAYLASGIYLLGQTDIFATVMPGMPIVDNAGFLGSTLWLLWLIILGLRMPKFAGNPATIHGTPG